MKKVAKRVIGLALILACLLAYIPQTHAAHPSELPNELFLTQNVSGTCTLCSSAMMIRTSMYLHGNQNWPQVTENALRSSAWLQGVGLLWNFTYKLGTTTVKVAHENISGVTEKGLKNLLDAHPEGIVLYCGSLPHAVFLTGYEGDVFYCADTVKGISEEQVPLKKSWLGIMYGSQAAVLKKVTAYWYVSDYMENGQSVGYCSCNRTYAGTYEVTYGPGVNIRAGHGTDSTLLGTIPYGTKVKVTKTSGTGSGHWAHITYNGISGYISMAYIKQVPCNHQYGDWSTSSVAGQEIRTCQLCGATQSQAAKPGVMGTITGEGVNVRAGAGMNYDIRDHLEKNERVEILETKTVDGMQWGRIQGGWVSMDYVKLDQVEEEKPISTGTVVQKNNISWLNVRAGAGTSYALAGQLNIGAKVELLEIKQVGTAQWGRISDGWILMEYVKLDSTESVIAMGTVTGLLNIRSAAGTQYTKVGQLQAGTRLEFYEFKQVGTAQWGRISNGWVLMDYVARDPEAGEQPIRTGTVSCSNSVSYLNVRVGAGTNYASVGQLYSGNKVQIMEFKEVGSTLWARIQSGWVSMDYVKLDLLKEEAKPQKGTVSGDYVNIRAGAGTGYSAVGQLRKNTKVQILETKQVGTVLWGRISNGWICMDYVKLDQNQVKIGTVANTNWLRIRSQASSTASVVDFYFAGDQVEILETKVVNGTTWGRTEKGWISMAYIR